MAQVKSIVLSRDTEGVLASHMASLRLLRRALSLPEGMNASEALPAFVELWGDEDVVRQAVANWPLSARAWLVEEHTPIAYERSWPSGTPSPGVRMVSSLYRRSGMERRDFEAYWLGPHTEVARSYTIPVWNYSQNIVVEALGEHEGEDGFVGMHFRSRSDLESRWADHPKEAARGAADAAEFMDVPRSVSMLTRETVWNTG
jgi:hypothetical protein